MENAQNTYEKTACALFSAGYNCAQAVFLAFATEEDGLSKETALRLSAPFGGGMGRMGEVCGALSGAFMALGLRRGYADPQDTAAKAALYDEVQALGKAFAAEHGTLLCRELLENAENAQASAGSRAAGSPCGAFVSTAARLLSEKLAE